MRHVTTSLFVLSLVALPGLAQDVELNPGFIGGTLRVGGETITNAGVSASGAGFSASTSLNPNAVSATYSLTVNVPEGTTPTYSTSAFVRTDSNRDVLSFPSVSVVVSEGATTIQDFVVDDPAYIEGTVTVTGGGSYSNANISVFASSAPFFSASTTTFPSLGSTYRLPVVPGALRRINRSVNIAGINVSLPQVIVDLDPGETLVLDLEVDPPAATGVIDGTIGLPGSATVNRYDVFISGAASRSQIQSGAFVGGASTPYAFEELPDGNYVITGRAWLNSNDDRVDFGEGHYSGAFDPGRRPTLSSGSTETVDIFAQQAYWNGIVAFSGSVDLGDVSSIDIFASGVFGTPTERAFATDRGNPATGAYDLVVTAGEWVSFQGSLRFARSASDPDGYLNQFLSFSDDLLRLDPHDFAAGEVALRDHEFAMGSVAVNVSVADGGTLTNPSVNGSCEYRDPDTNQRLYFYNFSSSSSGQFNVSEGTVRFVGMEGTCSVTARATVGGSQVVFGILSLDVEPGVDVVVDIGGPGLTIDEPESGLSIDAPQVTVVGLVTDDVGVDTVTVNGIAATLTPTGNASDPNELAFEAVVPLPAKGPNTLTTVATDTSGKTATDTRTVYNDSGPPAVDFTPVDGAVTTELAATVVGSASDDAGIESLTVNGSPVPVAPDGSFSVGLTLALGPNFIEVVATDISGKVTTVTHEVTGIDNQPPTADAGGPYAVVEGSSVTLAGSGGDADGDPLTYEWDLDGDGAFETAGAGPTFSAATLDGPATVGVSLRVSDDLGLSATSSTTVEVSNAAPVIESLDGPVEPAPIGEDVSLVATFSDAGVPDTHSAQWSWGDGSGCETATDTDCALAAAAGAGSVSGTHAYAEPGVYTVGLTVSDDDGGSAQRSYQFVVVYDPNGGFVTGGGWIDVVAGSYAAAPELEGRGHFGFVSKYKKGASVPTGSTQFQFQVADLSFHSAAYDWLVIAGPKAQFKGRGTINGGGDYGFLITAIDEELTPSLDVDQFRIKIWDLSADDGVVFDNRRGEAEDGDAATALGGGSIVVHKGKK